MNIQNDLRQMCRVFLAGMALSTEMQRTVIAKDNGKGSDTMAWDNSEANECADRCIMFADAVLDKIEPIVNMSLEKMAERARDIKYEQDQAPQNNAE